MHRFLRWSLSLCYALALFVVIVQTGDFYTSLNYAGTSYVTDWTAISRVLPAWLLTITAIYVVLMGMVLVFRRWPAIGK